jgi:hypothetical protein
MVAVMRKAVGTACRSRGSHDLMAHAQELIGPNETVM